MTHSRPLADIEKHILPTIRLLMEIGMPDPLERMVKFYGERIRSLHTLVSIRVLEAAQSWLSAARSHEEVHGKGSMLNKDHPTYIRIFVTKEAGRPIPEQFRFPIRTQGTGRCDTATKSSS